MSQFIVSNVTFLDGGVELTFMRVPEDVRNDGRLVATRSFAVADDHPSYVDQITELRDLATDLVSDVFDDFDTAPMSAAPEEEDDEDDDKGMGE